MDKKPSDQASVDNPATISRMSHPIDTRYLGLVVFALVIAGITLGVTAVVMFFLINNEFVSDQMITGFVLAGLVVITLAVAIAHRLWGVMVNARKRLAGSQMHQRLVLILVPVAIIPTVIAFVMTAGVIRYFSEEFFFDRVNRANSAATDLANGYFDAQSFEMGFDLLRMAFDLRVQEDTRRGIADSPIGFRQYLYGQAILRNMSAVYVLDGEGQILARVYSGPELPYNLPPASAFAEVDEGQDTDGRFVFNAYDPGELTTFYGLLKLDSYRGGYLIGYQAINPRITEQLVSVRTFKQDNMLFRKRLGDIEALVSISYWFLGVIFLLGAVLIGLMLASTIVMPIGRLSRAAERISAGDLSARIDVRSRDGEIAQLGEAFNEMTQQLEEQRHDLVQSNKQSDDRRRFIEAVLTGVSAGVLGIDEAGRITLANRSAADFFGHAPLRLTGVRLDEVAPEFVPLLQQARDFDGDVGAEMEVSRRNAIRMVSVRITKESDFENESFILTFDDISDLLSAQRTAAWGDVARRIAHEIKNPLTPIQLSAERLRRKYRKEITTNPEIFEKCTDTIIRHVGDIGRMVNEFSSFARMPEPVMAHENLSEILKSAVFPYEVSSPEIAYEIDIAETLCVECDGRLIVQACTNLLKNATEAIEERLRETPSPPGAVHVSAGYAGQRVFVSVSDNGLGLPDAVRHRLTEPYMTTRASGTGLGLAIVSKIIEEHSGTLVFENTDSLGPSGAKVIFSLAPAPGAMEDAECKDNSVSDREMS